MLWLAHGSWQQPIGSVVESDPLRDTQEVAEELSVSHSMVISIWSKLGRWESLISGCLMSWPKIKKKSFWSEVLYTTTNHFSIRLLHVTKSGFYMTAGDDELSSWTEKKLQSTSQSQTCTRKGSWSLWWSAARLIHYSFLNAGETITSEKKAQQIDEMHWKLQHLQLVLVNRMGPILVQDKSWPPFRTNASEVEWTVLQSFISPAISPDILPTDYHFFRHLENFLQGKCFHNH